MVTGSPSHRLAEIAGLREMIKPHPMLGEPDKKIMPRQFALTGQILSVLRPPVTPPFSNPWRPGKRPSCSP